jgi:hypothetical protein
MKLATAVLLGSWYTVDRGCRAAVHTGPAMSWGSYKQRYNKSYSGTHEDDYRRGIFEWNVARYVELNTLEPLARYGPTAFSDMAASEYLGGFRPTTLAVPELAADMMNILSSAGVPAARDWTGTYTSPIKDQVGCGGCWAESAVEQVESDAMRQHRWTGVLSTQELIDCTSTGQGR